MELKHGYLQIYKAPSGARVASAIFVQVNLNQWVLSSSSNTLPDLLQSLLQSTGSAITPELYEM